MKDEIIHLKGTDCTVRVSVGERQVFHYTGKVMDVTDSLLIFLDRKTGQRMNFALSAIVSITEEGVP
jgi:hypothetical protein